MASSNVVKSVEIISSTTTLEKQLGAESQHIDVPYGIADGIILNDLTGKTEGTDYNNQSLADTLKNLQYAANILDSKNFIPTGDSKIIENITYTVADDGEITINGSNPSGVSTYTIELPNVIDEACYFTIDGPSTLNNAITIAMADDQGIYIEDYFGATGSTADGTAQLELDASSSIKYFKISVAQNGSISNLKIKPMLRLAVINDRTYAPYAKTNRELTALGSGHDIKDGGGNSYPKRKNLVFDNSVVTDDAINDATIVTPKGQDIALGDVEGAAISQNLDTVTLIWSDPADVVIGGTTLAAWAGTTVIRKAGSAPSDVNDGTLVVTNTTRDQYASTGYTDTGLIYGTTYYYRFFPYKMAGLTKIYTNGSSVSKTIEKTVISTIPSQSGTLTYDGTSQSPTWANYDSNQLTIGGDTSGTNAGTYTATFTPNYGYKWSDNTETAKDVNWIIGKADATGTLSKNSVSLTMASPSDTVTVSNASGTISARSGNTSVATVSVSGSTITITGVANGSTTVTVTIAASSDGNYKSGTRSISVGVEFISSTLNDNSWEVIKSVGAAGTGANYWSVGDTKTIKLNGTVGRITLSDLSVKVFIIDFNYRGTNGIYFQGFKSTASIDIALIDDYYDADPSTNSNFFSMNFWAWNAGSQSAKKYNYGGWKGCDLRYGILGSTDIEPSGYGSYVTTSRTGYDATSAAKTNPVANTLMAALPSDLRTVLAPWSVYTDNTGNTTESSSNVTASVDYLPLLAEYEVFGTRSYANQYECTSNKQKQMTYYVNGNEKVKFRHSDISKPAHWLCRSPRAQDNNTFCLVAANPANAYYCTSSKSSGIAPAFRVA